MVTDVNPILRVADAATAVDWYRRLRFEQTYEHRFEPHLPAYVIVRRDGTQIHLSEHLGDATPGTLMYLWVDDVDTIARDFGVTVDEAPWAREVELSDPDGNRLRIAQRRSSAETDIETNTDTDTDTHADTHSDAHADTHADADADADADVDTDTDVVLGEGTTQTLIDLERAMWTEATRGDRSWMDDHLTASFTEFGWSGAAYRRAEILDMEVGHIDATLEQFAVRPVGRDAAMVTYRTMQPRGDGNRMSLWLRAGGRWRLEFHQATPSS